MKTYKIDTINLSKYYLLTLKFTCIVIVIIIIILYILPQIFESLNYISLIIVSIIIATSFFIGKFEKGATTEVVIKINSKFMLINEEKIEIRNIVNFKIQKKVLSFYPKIIISTISNKEISFYTVKYNKDYLSFVESLNGLKL